VTKPFTWSGDKAAVLEELKRFEREAGRFKPDAYGQDMDLRLQCFLWRHRERVVDELKKSFQKTYAEITPYVLPVTQFFVEERAKVFLEGADLTLVDADGEPLGEKPAPPMPAAGAGGAAAPPKPPAKPEPPPAEVQTWTKLCEDVALGLKLKRLDRYTTLFSTAFMKWGHSERGVAAQIAFPQVVDVVFDPAYPFDLDMAHGVRVEIGGDASLEVTEKSGDQVTTTQLKRYEFWCARPGEEQYQVLRSDGTREPVEGNPEGKNPYADDEGKALVPLIMFTAHTEELGAFTLAGQGLHNFDLSVNVTLSDVHHIAKCQGYGQIVIEMGPAEDKPPVLEVGPGRAMPLPNGSKADVLNGNPQLAALIEMVDKDLKRAAVMNGIPAGAVSLEARAIATGVALQVELRPLMERRTDAIEVYALPMRRLWRTAKAVWNTYAGEVKRKDVQAFPAEIQARWKPGDIQVPSDPQVQLDNDLVELANDLTTPAEILAKRRHISLDEARALYDRMRAENAATKADVRVRSRQLGPAGNAAALAEDTATEGGAAGITAGAKAKLQPPGAQRRGADGAAASAGGANGAAG
jgi:hypothetical protein